MFAEDQGAPISPVLEEPNILDDSCDSPSPVKIRGRRPDPIIIESSVCY